MKYQVGFLISAILLGACATLIGIGAPMDFPADVSRRDFNSSVPVTQHIPVLNTTATSTPFLPVEPTPADPQPVRLTDGGCCSLPMWSQDSEWVLFLDKPSDHQRAGLYGVPVDGGDPTLVHDQVGVYSDSMTLVAYPNTGRVYVERWADGARWTIPSQGRIVRFSPSGQSVTWEVGSRSIRYPDVRQRTLWVADSDGSNAHEVVTVNGGELIGWEKGEEAFYVTGRFGPSMPSGVWRVDIETGAARLLMEIERPRSPLLSPDGGYIALFVAFASDPESNGLWVIPTDGSPGIKLDLFGAYRWRYEGILLVIPLDIEAPGISFWQVSASSGEAVQLTDPERTKISIANNDWQVSPNGKRVVFLSAEDRNLWILRLPNL